MSGYSIENPKCKSCEHVDSCEHKEVVGLGALECPAAMVNERQAAVEAGQPFAAPSAKERDIKRAIEKEFYDRHFNLFGR